MNEAKHLHDDLLNGLLPIVRGYQIQTSELATPEALERLILILAITTLHLTSIGLGVVQAGKRRFVDTHWDRGLSYLKIGWRWRRQQYQHGWQDAGTFLA